MATTISRKDIEKFMLKYADTALIKNVRRRFQIGNITTVKHLRCLAGTCRLWDDTNIEHQRPKKMTTVEKEFWKTISQTFSGKIVKSFYLNIFIPNLNSRGLELLKRRRDIDLYVTDKNDILKKDIFETDNQYIIYEVVEAVKHWFNINDDLNIYNRKLIPYAGSLQKIETISELCQLLFVDIPFFFDQPHLGKYSSTLRFIRALLVICHHDIDMESLFLKTFLEPLNVEHPENLLYDRSVEYKHIHVTKKRRAQMLLLGQSINLEHIWSLDIIIDITELFKYIDISLGSFFWLNYIFDVSNIVIPVYTNQQRLITQQSQSVISTYVLQQLFPMKMSADIFIDSNKDIYLFFDFLRRKYNIDPLKLRIAFDKTIYQKIAHLYTYDWLDDNPLRQEIIEMDKTSLLGTLVDTLPKNIPQLYEWLNTTDNYTVVKGTIITNQTNYIFSKSVADPLFAILYELYVLSNNSRSPKKSDLCYLDFFDSQTSYPVLSAFKKCLQELYDVTILNNENGFYLLYSMCCDYICILQNKYYQYDFVWKDCKAKNNIDTFLEVYRRIIFYGGTNEMIKSIFFMCTGNINASYLLFTKLPFASSTTVFEDGQKAQTYIRQSLDQLGQTLNDINELERYHINLSISSTIRIFLTDIDFFDIVYQRNGLLRE